MHMFYSSDVKSGFYTGCNLLKFKSLLCVKTTNLRITVVLFFTDCVCMLCTNISGSAATWGNCGQKGSNAVRETWTRNEETKIKPSTKQGRVLSDCTFLSASN